MSRIGFYACSGGRGGIVRVGRPEWARGKPPRTTLIECPVCGDRHRVALLWRAPTPRDANRKIEVIVGGESRSGTPPM